VDAAFTFFSFTLIMIFFLFRIQMKIFGKKSMN
jgi:hypothetical protein